MKFKMSITLKIKMPQPMTNDKWYTFKIVDVSISQKKAVNKGKCWRKKSYSLRFMFWKQFWDRKFFVPQHIPLKGLIIKNSV